MNLRTCVIAATIGAFALAGCEWGGADGESGTTWNDSYNWLNFSGTYRLSSAISSSDEEAEPVAAQEVAGSQNFSIGYGTSASGQISKTPLKPGSVTIAHTDNEFNCKDNGSGYLSGSSVKSGTIDYTTGAWTVNFTKAIKGSAKALFTYTVSGSTPSSKMKNPISSLTIRQNGNLIYITDSNGVAYSGKVTGVNVGAESYATPCHASVTFEATSGNRKIAGTLGGDWTGGATPTMGTLSGRTISGSYSVGNSYSDISGSAN